MSRLIIEAKDGMRDVSPPPEFNYPYKLGSAKARKDALTGSIQAKDKNVQREGIRDVSPLPEYYLSPNTRSVKARMNAPFKPIFMQAIADMQKQIDMFEKAMINLSPNAQVGFMLEIEQKKKGIKKLQKVFDKLF